MAMNIETLKTRSLTAVIFVVVMLAGLLWNEWSFIALFTIIHFGCWYEFVKLMKKINGDKFLPYCVLGLIYITWPILSIYFLAKPALEFIPDVNFGEAFSNWLPLLLIASIWINDTMAYIVGSLIGKTPFSKISPKKTWEGTAGGVFLCVIAMGLIGYFMPIAQSIALQHWLVIAAIAAIAGTLGDLFESKLKRMANLKDSGSFMPGHGGFLDRFDSLLIATPFVWLYVRLFMQ